MASGPDSIERGIQSLDEVANAPGIPLLWRQQALVRKARALRELRRDDEALEACYDALSVPPGPGPDGQSPDDSWFYSAGEEALRILKAQGKAEQSVEIARKMAQSPGPHGQAARELKNQLLLEFGIYDGQN